MTGLLRSALLPALLWLALLPGAAFSTAPERSNEDLARDARDKTEQIIAFAGITPGMHVADLLAGGGYWSDWLRETVGSDGHVLLYNNPQYAKFAREDLAERVASGRLEGVEQRVAPIEAMALGEATFDRIVMVMALHDLYWVDESAGWPAIDHESALKQVVAALKPGGALLVIDHAAFAGSGTDAVNSLHRIDEAFVRRTLERHGLLFEAESTLLRNAADKRSKGVFDPKVKGKTDRFVHLYRKPAESKD
jgi:predicted methyltransferase